MIHIQDCEVLSGSFVPVDGTNITIFIKERQRYFRYNHHKKGSRKNGAMITPSQSRAARALLKWTVVEAGKRSGLGKNTVLRFESEDGNPQRSSGIVIENAYRAAGVEFPDLHTVKLKPKD
jgi:hypothetical protein